MSEQGVHVVREAGLADIAAIIDIDRHVYGGTDYLPAHLDHFILSQHITPFVYELEGEIVGFVAVHLVDDGQTAVYRAGRVSERFRGRGIYRALLRKVGDRVGKMGTVKRLAVATTAPKPGSRLVIEKTFHEYLLEPGSDYMQQAISLITQESSTHGSNIRVLKERDIFEFISDEEKTSYTFPFDRMLVHGDSFRLLPANIPSLFGKMTILLSDINKTSTGVSGLFTAGTIMETSCPKYTCNIDIDGSDMRSLNDHLAWHFRRVYATTREQTFIRILAHKRISETSLDVAMAIFGGQRVANRDIDVLSFYETSVNGQL